MDDGFIEYLRSLGTLCEKSIRDDISRINSMKKRNIDYTKGEQYAKRALYKANHGTAIYSFKGPYLLYLYSGYPSHHCFKDNSVCFNRL